MREWQVKNNIEPFRIFVGEFGAWRNAKGADQYLEDLTQLFDEFGWSWAHYAFREDDWDVADLELTGARPGRRKTSLFEVIQ